MANQFLRMGRLDQAKTLYRQVLASEPDNARAAASLGLIYQQQEKFDEAIRHLTCALDLEPDNVNTRLELGASLRDFGDLEQARYHFLRVLDLEADNPLALVALAHLNRNKEYDDDIRSLEELYGRPDLPRNQRRRLAFTLAKIFDDLKEYDKAFEFMIEANRIAREAHQPVVEAEAQHFQQIRATFNADFFRRYESIGIPDRSPIFVTGLPRSGTSLVEQILASHPDVHGAGEIDTFRNIVLDLGRILGTRFPVGFDTLDAKLLQEKAAEYIKELKSLAHAEQFITDKSMASVRHFGLIGLMLPGAKIIYCNRDPRDQGLSFFQHDFLDRQPYSYDLGDIAAYYRIFHSLMEHWDRMLPGRIYRIHYEALVADQENSTRRLLEHCGLPFDPACLAFHETERTVYTASLAQVREPLYASSVGRWRNYQKQLQPLIAALGLKSTG